MKSLYFEHIFHVYKYVTPCYYAIVLADFMRSYIFALPTDDYQQHSRKFGTSQCIKVYETVRLYYLPPASDGLYAGLRAEV